MEIGEISPIVATHYGFHLFKVTDRREAAPIPRSEIPGLDEKYLGERRAKEIAALIDRVKSVSTIEEVAETRPVPEPGLRSAPVTTKPRGHPLGEQGAFDQRREPGPLVQLGSRKMSLNSFRSYWT